MTRINRSPISFVAVALALSSMPSWGAKPQGEASEGPVPALIVSAKKVFISNAGGGCDPFGSAHFKGGPNRPYNQFYAALKSWGRYELVASPADAELVFEIGFTCPVEGTNIVEGGRAGPTSDPQLRLVILDVKTHFTLWGITEHVGMAILQGNRDKNFDRAINKLVDDLKSLAAGTPPPFVDVDPAS
jgi:hypothetical protein